jgi:hypothetical protein
MTTTAEIIDLPAQREWRRIQAAVLAVNQRTELAHIRLACGVIDQTKHDSEIASVLEELAQLRRDLELVVERWPSIREREDASQKVS